LGNIQHPTSIDRSPLTGFGSQTRIAWFDTEAINRSTLAGFGGIGRSRFYKRRERRDSQRKRIGRIGQGGFDKRGTPEKHPTTNNQHPTSDGEGWKALRVFSEGEGAPRGKGVVRAESDSCQAEDTTLAFAPGGAG
jgi:hypothetical protein